MCFRSSVILCAVFLCVYLQRHDEARLCSGTRSNSGASGGLTSPYVILMAASWEEADGFV